MIKMPIAEARRRLTSLPESVGEEPVAITRRGKEVLVMMPYGLYETMADTIEILADENLRKALECGIRDVKEGRVVSWKEARKELLPDES